MALKEEIIIIAVSDTHTIYDFADVPEGDLLIIAGDILLEGTVTELQTVMLQLDMESHKWKHILIVPGNHDFIFQQYYNQDLSWEKFMEDCGIKFYPKNLTISIEGTVEILGLTIFTWSWVPYLPRWAFSMFDSSIERYIQKKFKMPEIVDIVVTHGPPYGILDWIPGYGKVGSKTMEEVFNFKYNLHIFGHIHENYGTTIQDSNNIIHTDNAEFRRYYNVSILNDQYKIENKPIKILLNGRQKKND
jgi:Icc-related predicted phosphoesterase